MKRVKLVIAYAGTNYHGWQMQPNGLSIEAVIGASRTDSGVHALGNVWLCSIPKTVCRQRRFVLP